MDPDEALAKLREAAEALAGDEPIDAELIAFEMATQFQALDEWLCKGGFLPKGWRVLG